MNRQKLASIVCIILSIVFSISLGLFIHFKAFIPTVSNVYEKLLYYSEDLYKEYQEEAERMIISNEFTCKYPSQMTCYSEDGRINLVIEIGEYDDGKEYSDYLTATVKNFGTNDQEINFERSRKSAEEAYESAEKYRTSMSILTLVFGFILISFTTYLIKNSVKRRYSKVICTISVIVACIVMFIVCMNFLLA